MSERGINLRGNYDEDYGYHDKGENTVYKDWWIASNQSGKQGLPDPSQMDFHNYGGATPSKYFANVYTMYNKETLAGLGYEYSLGDIDINSQTTMNVTYKDSRVTEFDDSYGHNYRLNLPGQTLEGFLKFDLHNLGTTESGKVISAHVTVNKWKADRDTATYAYRQVGDMGGYGEGVQTKYEFYDEDTGEKLNLVRMFEMIDTEAGEYLHIRSNDKVRMVIPKMPSDVTNGVTRGYASIINETENGAGLLGDKYFANANFTEMSNQPVTKGNNNSTPLAMGIGTFAGNTLVASWDGAGGGLNCNSRNISFKEKPKRPAVFDVGQIPEPKCEKVPSEPTYETVPEPLNNPVKPEEPKLNPIVEPVKPTEPNLAEPSAPTNEPKEVEKVTVRYRRNFVIQLDTNWVDEDGNKLKDTVTDETTKEHGEIDNYSFVKTTKDADGNVTHIFRQYTTKWVDEDGKELKPSVKGSKTVEIGEPIPEHYYKETIKDEKDNVTYVFRKVKTSYVTEDGKELFPTEDGTHKEKSHVDYSYRKTEVDKNGNTKHIYKLLHTIHVDENGNEIAPKEDGQKPQKEISGYSYVRTEPLIEDGIIKHIYHQVTTSWKSVDGVELKPTEKGVKEHGTFTGYKLLRTETGSNGDIVHIFEKDDNIHTGVSTNARVFMVLGGIALIGLVIIASKRVRD